MTSQPQGPRPWRPASRRGRRLARARVRRQVGDARRKPARRADSHDPVEFLDLSPFEPSARIRVLDVGAGYGLISSQVLDRLRRGRGNASRHLGANVRVRTQTAGHVCGQGHVR